MYKRQGLDNTNDSSNVDMDFHQLLTRANVDFDDKSKLDIQLNKGVLSVPTPPTSSSSSSSPSVPTPANSNDKEFEAAIESAMKLTSGDLLDSTILNADKHFTLDSLLGDENDTDMLFALQMADNQTQAHKSIEGENSNIKRNISESDDSLIVDTKNKKIKLDEKFGTIMEIQKGDSTHILSDVYKRQIYSIWRFLHHLDVIRYII